MNRLAEFSSQHADELGKLEVAEAKARHDREILEWAAEISTRAAEQLRVLQSQEAAEQDVWRRIESLREVYCENLNEWNEADHPRQPQGSAGGGQFVAKGGGSGGKGFLRGVLGRNHEVGELSGVVTPKMVQSNRLAIQYGTASQLPAEVTAEAAAGLKTGLKAIVNGTATAIRTAATLGVNSAQLELIGVTKEDRARGYDAAVTIASQRSSAYCGGDRLPRHGA